MEIRSRHDINWQAKSTHNSPRATDVVAEGNLTDEEPHARKHLGIHVQGVAVCRGRGGLDECPEGRCSCPLTPCYAAVRQYLHTIVRISCCGHFSIVHSHANSGVLQEELDMRQPQLLEHYGGPGLVPTSRLQSLPEWRMSDFFCGIAKDFRHAPVTGKHLSAGAYEEPSSHHEIQKPFPVIGGCPKPILDALGHKHGMID